MPGRWILATLLALSAVAASASCGRPSASGPRASTNATCPPGAGLGAAGCLCRSDLSLVLGACVPARTAAVFCGPAYVAASGTCEARPAPCERGRALDLGTGACLPRREVRALAVSLGILVGDDELVGCPREGGLLVADSQGLAPRLGCLPPPSESTPVVRCPAGAAPGGRGGATGCWPIYDRGTVDVTRWAEAAVTPLCEAMARRLGTVPAGATVSLVFPDNDVSLVTSQSTAELEAALSPLMEALRSLGGTASQATVSRPLACAPSAAERPAALGPENDHEK